MTARVVLLTGVVSRTHLLYAASWLREQQRVGRPVREVAVRAPRPFLGELRVTTDECLRVLSEAVAAPVRMERAAEWTTNGGGPSILLCIGAPALRQVFHAVRSGRRVPHVVVVDEGLGSYGDRTTRAAAYRRNGDSPLWSRVRAIAVALGRDRLTHERWATYVRSADRWHVNVAVADEFRRRVAGRPPGPGTAVLLTQPWPALGAMSESAYRSHVEEVARQCDEAGLDLVIRPHPADSVDRYRALRVMTHDLPAELDRGVIEADVVLGAASTALLNLAAFHGTRCVRVRPDELRAMDEQLGADQAAVLDTFLPPPLAPADLVGRDWFG